MMHFSRGELGRSIILGLWLTTTQLLTQRNLVDNKGWLDEVLWVVNTENEDDLKYLDEILASSPRYKKLDLGRKVRGPEFRQIWKHLERGKIYVKIDDDVVSRVKPYFLVFLNIAIINHLSSPSSAGLVSRRYHSSDSRPKNKTPRRLRRISKYNQQSSLELHPLPCRRSPSLFP